MKFEDLAFEYRNRFDKQPPILSTVDENDPLYLHLLKEAIDNNEPLTLDALGSVFMTDKNVFY